MPKKIDLKKEAAKSSKKVKIKNAITEEFLKSFCPKEYAALFRQAKTQGARADLLFQMDKDRLAMGKKVEELKSFVSKLEAWFIQELPDKDATGIAGKLARVQVVKKERPNVISWDAFYGHIRKNSAFELLNRAPNAKAIKERWEAGKKVPGVDKFTYKDVSITKVKK